MRRLVGVWVSVSFIIMLLPVVASAAGTGPPEALFGICQGGGTGGADPLVSQDPGAGYGPWVIFDFANQDWRTPLGTAPVFGGAGACTFTQPAN
jgi:hypothetical protein